MFDLFSTKTLSIVVAAAMLACDKTPKPADSGGTGTVTPQPAGASFSATPLTPTGSGKVITVEVMTDEAGNNRFSPNEVEAAAGDVIRFSLKSGVHNVHFLADSNATSGGFPTTPSDMLQLPGQTIDVAVAGPAGKYFFQCDPHALLGMVGHVTVK